MALSPDHRKTEQKGGWAGAVEKSLEGGMIKAGPSKCFVVVIFAFNYLRWRDRVLLTGLEVL